MNWRGSSKYWKETISCATFIFASIWIVHQSGGANLEVSVIIWSCKVEIYYYYQKIMHDNGWCTCQLDNTRNYRKRRAAIDKMLYSVFSSLHSQVSGKSCRTLVTEGSICFCLVFVFSATFGTGPALPSSLSSLDIATSSYSSTKRPISKV